MKKKKNDALDIEKDRLVFLQLGVLVVSSLMLMAFTWRTPLRTVTTEIPERSVDIPTIAVLVEPERIDPAPKIETITPEKSTQPSVKILTDKIEPVSNTDKSVELSVSPDFADDVVVSFDEIPVGPKPELDLPEKYPDVDAAFDGNWRAYLAKNLVYPEESIIYNETGKIALDFVVSVTGEISNIKVLEGSHKSKALRKEAIRVVKNAPAWKPGIKNGEYVTSYKRIIINFVLE